MSQLNPVTIETCPICYTDIETSDQFITGCRHRFHNSCITLWMQLKNNCPMCRKTLAFDAFSEINNSPELRRTYAEFWGEEPPLASQPPALQRSNGQSNLRDVFNNYTPYVYGGSRLNVPEPESPPHNEDLD